MAGHAQLNFVMTECSKTQIRLTGLKCIIPESTVFFPKSEFQVDEKVGQLQIPIYRTGDLSQELTVICYTQGGKLVK